MPNFVKLNIEGMHCSACAARLEKVLDDEYDTSVSFASHVAIIRSRDASEIDLNSLNERIKGAGLRATPFKLRDIAEEKEKSSSRIWKSLIAVMGLVLFVVNMIPMLIGGHHILPVWVQAVVATLLLFYSGIDFWFSAFASVRNRYANMDVLVVSGSFIAWAYSFFAWVYELGDIYFEATGMIISLVMIGKMMEEMAKNRANREIVSIAATLPKVARIQRIDKDGEKRIQEIPVENLMPGDIVILKQGDRVPIDGSIVEGELLLDESFFTGEAVPVLRAVGDQALAGMLVNSGSGALEIEKTETELESIMESVASAQGGKTSIQRLADKVASIFVPVIVILSVLTFVITWAVTGDWIRALMHAIAVLVVACPCALGLATPSAIMVSVGFAAKNGILFRRANALELASKITHIAFDKTGTLTEGKFSLNQLIPAERVVEFQKGGLDLGDPFQFEMLRVAASLESKVNHPFAEAILSAFPSGLSEVRNFDNVLGSGIEGEVDLKLYRLGAAEWFDLSGDQMDAINGLRSNGISVLVLGELTERSWRAVAVFILKDRVKRNALEVIDLIKSSGVRTMIISGDSERNVSNLADQLKVDQYHASTTPAKKLELISSIKDEKNVIAMVGDGINDAPALATANISFAMATGADISVSAADVTLVSSDLHQVWTAINLSRKTLTNIRQNLFFAFAYNSVAIVLAMFGFLTPVIAALAMSLSSLCVVGNALRLNLILRRSSV